ncbi:hypothetical protein ABW636_17630 [Aquimarina sp. 2201CG1-2-11]|uniref:hypothetical protein n=1 Tax=Aquimarina discodermiae TaxID=3231043 RepID=UPI00346335D6
MKNFNNNVYKYFFLSLSLFGCNEEEPIKLKFEELPIEVRNKFTTVYNYSESPKVNLDGDTILYTPPFVECHNLDSKYKCQIESKGGIIRNPFFIVKSDNKNAKIPWSVLERVFIIKNDSVYYPISKGGIRQYGESRAKWIKIDTLKFESKKMN